MKDMSDPILTELTDYYKNLRKLQSKWKSKLTRLKKAEKPDIWLQGYYHGIIWGLTEACLSLVETKIAIFYILEKQRKKKWSMKTKK